MATPLPTNGARFSVAAIAAATGGVVVRDRAGEGGSVTTDSRTIEAGAVFVALVGERHDAHAFVASVAEHAPFAVIVSRDVDVPAPIAIVRVPDTLRALGDLARAHTARLRGEGTLRTVIGVTGSVGKTTTKEMLAWGLRSGRPEGAVAATVGNLNNLIGVPMTLLALDARAQIAVIEMGMNVPGEIARLAAIARPDVGVVTAIAAAHTEGVRTLEGIAEEKAALLRELGETAVAIAPADDDVIEPFLTGVRAKLLRAGRSERAGVRLIERVTRPEGTHGAAIVDPSLASGSEDERTVSFHMPLFGEGVARNATTAIAVGLAVGGLDEAKRVAGALGLLPATPGRLALLQGTRGTLLLDDSYNASPRATQNALETAAELAHHSGGRVVAVLGDMLELGALEHDLHVRVGEDAARLGVSMLVACGSRMRAAAEELAELGGDYALAVDDPTEAIEPVRQFVQPGDVIVVKGSRGMRMERVVAALEARGTTPPFAMPEPAGDGAKHDGEAA